MTTILRRGTIALAAVAASLLAALTAGGTTARAQGISSYPSHPFTIEGGLYLPSNEATRNQLGIDWLAYGAAYDFHSTSGSVPQTFSVYLDYFDEEKTTGPSDLRLRSEASVLAGGISDRYYFLPHYALFQPYVGAGFGVYNIHAKFNEPGSSGNAFKTAIGGKVLAGVEMREGLFLQAEYNWLPEPKPSQRVNLSGVQLRLGYRF